ncbi:uncharacterized protein LOC120335895 isoform X1 [Styela clava]
MAELKLLKVNIEGSNANVSNHDLVLKTDIEKVGNAITSAAGEIAPDKCLLESVLSSAQPTASTSLYVAAESIIGHTPWVKINEIQANNVLAVSVPKQYGEKFNKLITDGKITRKVKSDFEDLDTTVMRIPGANPKKQKEILDLIDEVRIESIEIWDKGSEELNCTAGEIIEGKNTDTITNKHTVVIGDGEGCVVGTLMKKGSDVKRTIQGGTTLVVGGLKGKDLEKVLETYEKIRFNSNARQKAKQIEDRSDAAQKLKQIEDGSDAAQKLKQIEDGSNVAQKLKQMKDVSNATQKVKQIEDVSKAKQKVKQIEYESNATQKRRQIENARDL